LISRAGWLSIDAMTKTLPSVARGLLGLSLALLVTAALAACGSSDDKSSASGDSAAAKTCPDGGLKFGVEPFEDPAKLTPAYQTVGAALSKALDCPVEVQIVEDYSAEVLAMQNGKLDLAQFGPLGYVFAHQRAKAEAVASFADGSGKLTTYKAGIWVPKSSPIKDVAGLKGKSLALADEGSTSGDALPRKAILDAGLKESDVKLNYTGGHAQSMLALTKGKIDAAEVNTQQLATAEREGQWDGSKYRQIWSSAPIPNDPITLRGDLDPSVKEAVTDALLKLPAADVAKVGIYLGVDPPGPLVSVQQSTYRPLFDLAKTLGLTEKDA
jgi:phosphonate transport system substrate-binding protein